MGYTMGCAHFIYRKTVLVYPYLRISRASKLISTVMSPLKFSVSPYYAANDP